MESTYKYLENNRGKIEGEIGGAQVELRSVFRILQAIGSNMSVAETEFQRSQISITLLPSESQEISAVGRKSLILGALKACSWIRGEYKTSEEILRKDVNSELSDRCKRTRRRTHGIAN